MSPPCHTATTLHHRWPKVSPPCYTATTLHRRWTNLDRCKLHYPSQIVVSTSLSHIFCSLFPTPGKCKYFLFFLLTLEVFLCSFSINLFLFLCDCTPPFTLHPLLKSVLFCLRQIVICRAIEPDLRRTSIFGPCTTHPASLNGSPFSLVLNYLNE